jgi:hypothetical protein
MPIAKKGSIVHSVLEIYRLWNFTLMEIIKHDLKIHGMDYKFGFACIKNKV